MSAHEAATAIRQHRVIGIVRTQDAASAATAVDDLLAAGLRVVEVALTTPGALPVIEQAARDAGDAWIGAGTVLDAESARLAILAGARFVVSPVYRPDVVETARRYGALAIPGTMTPTEALAAYEHGAELVKLFPASMWSPGSLRDLLHALPQLPLVPTGGIDAAAAPEWLRAGAVAVGLGSSLTRGGVGKARERVRSLLVAIDA